MAKQPISFSIRFRENITIDQVNSKVYRATGDALEDEAKEILKYIRKNWSPKSPSAWGMPPAVVTGRLDRSGRVALRGADGKFVGAGLGNSAIEASVFFTAPYADILESKVGLNRPFMRPAVNEVGKVSGKRITGKLITKLK